MSTRSRIGYLDDGVVKSVYCHFDGYLSGVGRTLVQNYRTLDEVKKLISLGSISALGKSTEYSESLLDDGTRDYHRWRGEEIEIETDFGVQDFVQSGFDCGEDYIYLFVPFMGMGDWYYLEYGGSWQKVADHIDAHYFMFGNYWGDQTAEMLYFPDYVDRDVLQSDVDRLGERFEKIKDAYGFVNGLDKPEYILECLKDCYRFDIVPWDNSDKVIY